jgi:NADH-quinone oxidoreductase subunit J
MMTVAQVIFVVISAVALVSAVLVVASRNIVHAALWLILALFGVAGLFAVLEAGFIAVVQVVIYVGAIATLIIFAIMLTGREMREAGRQTNRWWPLPALLSAALFAGLAWLLTSMPGTHAAAPALAGEDSVLLLGQALLAPEQFVLPFEVASVLLLAALIGAIVIAGESRK